MLFPWFPCFFHVFFVFSFSHHFPSISQSHRIHGAGIYANIKGVYCWDPCRVSRRFCALEIRRRIGGDQLVEMPWKVEVFFMGIYRDIYGNYGDLWEIYGNIWWWKIASGNLLQFANLKITIESSLTYTLNMVIFHSFLYVYQRVSTQIKIPLYLHYIFRKWLVPPPNSWLNAYC